MLRIQSGDSVYTETIDAFGRDKNGVKRQGGGNPLTGPFYIETTQPGDVLEISLHKVALNRGYAYTSESFVSRSMPDSIASRFRKPLIVKWTLNIEHGLYWCSTGAVVYLPVFHAGVYFYIGDGHAVQGDGEIAGNALKTSMDVVFSIRLIKSGALQITYPMIENASYIMAVGTDKSMEKAIKKAGVGLPDWLQARYRITLAEATQVMSTTIEYTIAELADPEIVVVAKIKKELLAGLKKSGSN